MTGRPSSLDAWTEGSERTAGNKERMRGQQVERVSASAERTALYIMTSADACFKLAFHPHGLVDAGLRVYSAALAAAAASGGREPLGDGGRVAPNTLAHALVPGLTLDCPVGSLGRPPTCPTKPYCVVGNVHNM